jgi:hypothetical protein
VIDDLRIAEIAAAVPRSTDTFLLTAHPCRSDRGPTGRGRNEHAAIRGSSARGRTAAWAPAATGREIGTVQAHGLDLCSHVRTDGQLDGGKLRAFMQAIAVATP